MAITRTKKGYYLVGLSTDDKPTTGVPLFSYFMESNTGDVYVYRLTGTGSNTEWVKILD